MMAETEFLQIRCHNHVDRESVARCTVCQQSFCRECIAFYDNKMTCNLCVKNITIGNEDVGEGLLKSSLYVFFFLSFSAWVVFYGLCEFLAWLPFNI